MNRYQALNDVVKQLSAITPSAEAEARALMTCALGCDLIDIVIDATKPLTSEETEHLKRLLQRRLKREPLQHILGVQYFCGNAFEVNENVLIPRPETEILVERIVSDCAHRQGLNILDIGTGSGAIAISLAQRLPSAQIVAVDISPKALNVAIKNELKLLQHPRITWLESDLFERVEERHFDVIVSNPPYIPNDEVLEAEVVDFEPHLALFGGIDGLDIYRKMVPMAADYLKPGGMMYVEAGHDQARCVSEIFGLYGFEGIDVFNDLCDIPRFIKASKVKLEE